MSELKESRIKALGDKIKKSYENSITLVDEALEIALNKEGAREVVVADAGAEEVANAGTGEVDKIEEVVVATEADADADKTNTTVEEGAGKTDAEEEVVAANANANKTNTGAEAEAGEGDEKAVVKEVQNPMHTGGTDANGDNNTFQSSTRQNKKNGGSKRNRIRFTKKRKNRRNRKSYKK